MDLAPDLERGAAQFAGMALDAVVIAHSSSSILGGEGWDAAAAARLKQALPGGTAVTTNGEDCVAALRACDVERPFLVFPPWFTGEAMQAGAGYFSANGFTPAKGVRHRPETRWADVPPRELYPCRMHLQQRLDLLDNQIVAECPDEADGVLLVGTGLRCVGIIEDLEATLRRPVVTANQASLWRSMRITGIETSVIGYGRLLASSR